MTTITKKRDDERASLEMLTDLLDDMKKAVDRLWKIHETEYGDESNYLENGAFTDTGKKRLYQMFADGERNADIARFFGVTDAAVAYHRKIWLRRS